MKFPSLPRFTGAEMLFSLKCFVSAMLALYVASRVGLNRPFWAMMTAYVVASPLAGTVRSKALYRLLGTFLGSAATLLLVPTFANAPELLTHANGATGIEQLNVAVLDLDVSLSRWRALLGAHTAPAGIEEDAARGLRTARIALDGLVVILESPAHTNGNAQLAQHLATRGEGPYAMRLRGVSAPWNDPAAAHGFVPIA